MRWSLVLATRNGEDTLPLTLAALARVAPAAGGLEIILVDNGSTDATPRLLRGFAEAHAARVLVEPRPGKSHALNRAIESARGALLAFVDDDVLPSPAWLRAYECAAAENPQAAVLAGAVRPHWLAPAPAWAEELADSGHGFGCTQAGATAGAFSASAVKGGNVAIRAAALGALRFDTGAVNFGGAGSAIGGEDTRLMRALEAGGGRIVHVPEAVVGHVIGADELTLASLFHRSLRIGRGGAALAPPRASGTAKAALETVAYAAAIPVLLAAGRSGGAARQLVKLAKRLGAIDYALRGARL